MLQLAVVADKFGEAVGHELCMRHLPDVTAEEFVLANRVNHVRLLLLMSRCNYEVPGEIEHANDHIFREVLRKLHEIVRPEIVPRQVELFNSGRVVKKLDKLAHSGS